MVWLWASLRSSSRAMSVAPPTSTYQQLSVRIQQTTALCREVCGIVSIPGELYTVARTNNTFCHTHVHSARSYAPPPMCPHSAPCCAVPAACPKRKRFPKLQASAGKRTRSATDVSTLRGRMLCHVCVHIQRSVVPRAVRPRHTRKTQHGSS